VAAWDGNETSVELIARADQALYQAKDAGHGRILAAGRRPRRQDAEAGRRSG
jgi:GGDEF domain-containing protein